MGLQYRPMTDSFRELNRLIVEKESFDAAHKARAAEQGIQQMMLESQLKGQHQQQQLTQYKIAEEERKRTPKIINLNKFAQGKRLENIENNAKVMKHIGLLFGDNVEYKPLTKTWKNPDGTDVAFNSYEMRDRIPALVGFMAGATDTVAEAHINSNVLDKQMEILQKDINLSKDNPRYVGERVKMLKRMDTLKADKKKYERFLSPEGLLAHYEGKQDSFNRTASFYYNNGLTKLGDQMAKRAEQANKGKLSILDGMMKERAANTKSTGNQFTDAKKVWVTKSGTVVNGKVRAKGYSFFKRFAKDQESMNLNDGLSFDDPDKVKNLTAPTMIWAKNNNTVNKTDYKVGDGRKIFLKPGQSELIFDNDNWTLNKEEVFPKDGKNKPVPIISEKVAQDKLEKGQEIAGAMGQITDAAGTRKAKQLKGMLTSWKVGNNIGNRDSFSDGLALVEEVEGIETQEYHANIASGMSEEEAFAEYEQNIKEEFPGSYVVRRPSKIKDIMANVGR